MAFIIFTISMLMIYTRAFRVPVWASAALGGFATLIFGVISLADTFKVLAMVWDSTFVLVGLIIIAMALEKMGFFDTLASKIILSCARYSDGYKINTLKFFAIMMVFGLFVATFLANDGAILVLTPLIFAIFSKANQEFSSPLVAFLIFFGFLSDFGSNGLIISNLTNIITAKLFNISFGEYFGSMILAQCFAFIAACVIFWAILIRKLPKVLKFHLPSRQMGKFDFIIAFGLLISLPFGSAIFGAMGLPISGFILIVAVIAIMMQKGGKFELFSKAPFGVVIFSIGLFVMVYGVGMAGILEFLRLNIHTLANLDRFTSMLGIAVGSSIGSALINNLPMVMLGDLALRDFGADMGLVYSHLLGCNIGSKLTPIGSLATLLWLVSLKLRGVNIKLLDYFKLSFIFSFGVLIAAVCGLWIGEKLDI
ncbi:MULTISPECIES: ArsB/NhaD family transporter [Campylobacter]|uniref:ArsB/NhaD family transporter n=1 Tax=Campylobacter TaxID=194 RepID=UPI000A33A386|nr:ArsB/NhaD family transporter [Campylobacter sp. P0124]MCR8696920.1 SLC13 family permease [Campylobacter sp. RM19073]